MPWATKKIGFFLSTPITYKWRKSGLEPNSWKSAPLRLFDKWVLRDFKPWRLLFSLSISCTQQGHNNLDRETPTGGEKKEKEKESRRKEISNQIKYSKREPNIPLQDREKGKDFPCGKSLLIFATDKTTGGVDLKELTFLDEFSFKFFFLLRHSNQRTQQVWLDSQYLHLSLSLSSP